MTVTWILERDVFSEQCFGDMVDYFKTNSIPYHIVRVIPFIHEIEGKVPLVTGPCVVYGSIGTQKLAITHGWTPGVWTSPGFDETVLQDKLGDMLLNPDATVLHMTEVEGFVKKQGWPQFFIKPNSDTKEFAGMLMEADEFSEWLQKMLDIHYLKDNDFNVVVSTPKRLGVEWRIVMVDGKIADYSIYRQYQIVKHERSITPEVTAFAESAAARYSPAPVFVLDVVDTDDGLKIVEYNTFNSAGLYACDVANIIKAINDFVDKSE